MKDFGAMAAGGNGGVNGSYQIANGHLYYIPPKPFEKSGVNPKPDRPVFAPPVAPIEDTVNTARYNSRDDILNLAAQNLIDRNTDVYSNYNNRDNALNLAANATYGY
jgi:hypothetical protein